MFLGEAKPRKLEQDEYPILNIRRHKIVLVGRLLPVATILLVPVVLIVFSILTRNSDQQAADRTIRLSLQVFFLLLLPLGGWAAFIIYDWANDSFHVTNRRVIHFEQTYFTSQTMIEARLEQIQNVAVKIPNPLAQALHFGTVVIETAAQTGRIEFDSIPDPYRVQRTLFEVRNVPMPPEKPPLEWKNLHDLLGYLFPFNPQIGPDGSVTYHKHWFILATAVAPPLAFLVLILALAIILRSALPLLLLLLDLPFLLYQYVNWINDVYILTDRHIIDIVRIPLIKEDRREALLDNIQNVSFTVPNLPSRLLQMGDVFVETAGKAENFLFQSVHHPEAVQREISRRVDALRAIRQQSESDLRRRETEAMIEEILRRHNMLPPSSPGNGQTPVPGQ